MSKSGVGQNSSRPFVTDPLSDGVHIVRTAFALYNKLKMSGKGKGACSMLLRVHG